MCLGAKRDFGYCQVRLSELRAGIEVNARLCRDIVADSQAERQVDEEAKRVEADFNAKYEDFLDTQADMPKSILEKRQSELQELLNKNIEFKAESRRLLAQAEKDAFAPLHEKLQRALKVIGEQDGYAFIINTDNNACPFVNPAQGTDVTQTVVRLLQKL